MAVQRKSKFLFNTKELISCSQTLNISLPWFGKWHTVKTHSLLVREIRMLQSNSIDSPLIKK